MSDHLEDVLRRELHQRSMLLGYAALLIAIVAGLVAAIVKPSLSQPSALVGELLTS